MKPFLRKNNFIGLQAVGSMLWSTYKDDFESNLGKQSWNTEGGGVPSNIVHIGREICVFFVIEAKTILILIT